jgi:hypothetical protein
MKANGRMQWRQQRLTDGNWFNSHHVTIVAITAHLLFLIHHKTETGQDKNTAR